MRKKIGTVLDSDLLDRARAQAGKEGRALATLFEDALSRYLGDTDSRIERKYGVFRLSSQQLAEVIDADPYDT